VTRGQESTRSFLTSPNLSMRKRVFMNSWKT